MKRTVENMCRSEDIHLTSARYHSNRLSHRVDLIKEQFMSVRKQIWDICQSWNPTSACDVSQLTLTRICGLSASGLCRCEPETSTKLASSGLRELGEIGVERSKVELDLSTNQTRQGHPSQSR